MGRPRHRKAGVADPGLPRQSSSLGARFSGPSGESDTGNICALQADVLRDPAGSPGAASLGTNLPSAGPGQPPPLVDHCGNV